MPLLALDWMEELYIPVKVIFIRNSKMEQGDAEEAPKS